MVLTYRSKIPFQIIHHARIAIVVLFVLSTMAMISFHMSRRTFVSQLRDVTPDSDLKSDNCHEAVVERKRSLGGKMRNDANPGVSKIPKLEQLKSLRNTLDKVITVVEGKPAKQERKIIEEKQPQPPEIVDNATGTPKVKARKVRKIYLKEKEFLKSINTSHPYYYGGTFIMREQFSKLPRNREDSIFMNITRLKPPADVSFHVLSRDEPYRSRLLKVQESCANTQKDQFSDFVDLKRMIHDDRHRAVMCVVPKAACTTWKSIMFYLMGRSKLENAFNIDKRRLVLNYGFTSMAKFSRTGIVERLNTYTKFMVTRHPYHRLLSAYRNKFQSKVSSFVYSYGRQIAKKYLEKSLEGYSVKYYRKSKPKVLMEIRSLPQFIKLSAANQMKVLDIASRGYSGNVTFEEFLRYGIVEIEAPARFLDIHWRPQHMLCNPCAINYDFIIRFEDLEHESERVLQYLQKDDLEEGRIKFPGGKPATVTNTVTSQAFKKIPPALREALRKIYEKDFELFNYDPNHF